MFAEEKKPGPLNDWRLTPRGRFKLIAQNYPDLVKTVAGPEFRQMLDYALLEYTEWNTAVPFSVDPTKASQRYFMVAGAREFADLLAGFFSEWPPKDLAKALMEESANLNHRV